jgi:hypothetical protein
MPLPEIVIAEGCDKGSRRSSGVSEYKRRMGARLADLPPLHCSVLI